VAGEEKMMKTGKGAKFDPQKKQWPTPPCVDKATFERLLKHWQKQPLKIPTRHGI
jgi:hypothetical protein